MTNFKGFGKPPQKKPDPLVRRVVLGVQERSPEQCDSVFDTIAPLQMEKLIAGVVDVLSDDLPSLAWFFGYIASEINQTGDTPGSITGVALYLAQEHGWRLFYDLLPLPGKMAFGGEEGNKFSALPLEAQARVRTAFTFTEGTLEDLEAQAQEWTDG
jgi:hypothetical protein